MDADLNATDWTCIHQTHQVSHATGTAGYNNLIKGFKVNNNTEKMHGWLIHNTFVCNDERVLILQWTVTTSNALHVRPSFRKYQRQRQTCSNLTQTNFLKHPPHTHTHREGGLNTQTGGASGCSNTLLRRISRLKIPAASPTTSKSRKLQNPALLHERVRH